MFEQISGQNGVQRNKRLIDDALTILGFVAQNGNGKRGKEKRNGVVWVKPDEAVAEEHSEGYWAQGGGGILSREYGA